MEAPLSEYERWEALWRPGLCRGKAPLLPRLMQALLPKSGRVLAVADESRNGVWREQGLDVLSIDFRHRRNTKRKPWRTSRA